MKTVLITLPIMLYLLALLAFYFEIINSYLFIIIIIVSLIMAFIGYFIYRNNKRQKPIFIGLFLVIVLLSLFEMRLVFYEKYTYFVTSYFEPFEIVENSNIYVLAVDLFEAANFDNVNYLKSSLERSTNKEVLEVVEVTNKIRYRSKNMELLSYIRPQENHFDTMKTNVNAYLRESAVAMKPFFDRNDLEGDSAGLAAVLSGLIERNRLSNTIAIAVTGAIDDKGNVHEIGSMKAKIVIAEQSGFSHIILPEDNEKEAREEKDTKQLNIEILAVPSVEYAISEIERLNKQASLK